MEDILENNGVIPVGKGSSTSSNPNPTPSGQWPEYNLEAAKQGYLHLKYDSITSSSDPRLVQSSSSGVLTDGSSDAAYIRKDMVEDLKRLQAAYDSANIKKPKDAQKLKVCSGWRWIPSRKVGSINLRNTAPNGYSEHNTGYAVDLVIASTARWEKSDIKEVKNWLRQEAPKYNFRLSFPLESQGSTGVILSLIHI